MGTSDVTAAHFFAGVVGLSLLRGWYEDGTFNADRLTELTTIVNSLDQFPYSLALNPQERTMLDGYAKWADSYDGENPMINAEETAVLPILARLASPGCMALDVACGTGRHAKFLADLHCFVTGVDQSPEMLDVARVKVPDARFEIAGFERLPFANDTYDLAVCALALCHLEDPTSGVGEIARVLKPGGSLVVSDPHPFGAIEGPQAFYGGIVPGKPIQWVRNHHHLTSTWLRAFRAAGLTVVDCQEVLLDEAAVKTNPTALVFPEATTAALLGLPNLFVWELRKN
jgi:ubiquinone/menaquinone biosynthesis C-methylase UbiE